MHDAKVSWKVALKGAILTAILLYFSQWILSYYLQHFFMLGQLGIANSIFMMLAWVHYSAQIIFLGAKFTYQVGKATGDRISS
jgi:membrane protein